jgi:CHAD domain-containing protein
VRTDPLIAGTGTGDHGPVHEVTESRAYRFSAGEGAAEGARRIARGRIDDALAQLRGETGSDLATAVHEARKDLKKARSLLRLVRGDLGSRRYRAQNGRLREAGRLLSGPRDAEAKLETIEKLRERFGARVPKALLLVDALERERDEATGSDGEPSAEMRARMEEAVEAIAAVAASIEEWSTDGAGFSVLRPGLETSYRRGRERLAEVRSDPTAEAVHEWRKRVKDLWYHLRLLHDSWPAGLGGVTGPAHELSELLGDHHDLSVLLGDLEQRPPGEAPRGLIEHARRRQRELLAEAIPLGSLLYAEKPSAYSKRLASYWRAWHP